MHPSLFSESVAIGDVRPDVDASGGVALSTCLSVCDVMTPMSRRCKTGLRIEPTLSPVGFRDALILYNDSTRRRFRASVDYEPRLRPRQYQDTCFILPPRTTPPSAEKSFISTSRDAVDLAHNLPSRRWYSTSVSFDKVQEWQAFENGLIAIGERKKNVVRGGERGFGRGGGKGEGDDDAWCNGSNEKRVDVVNRRQHHHGLDLDSHVTTVIEVDLQTPAPTAPGEPVAILVPRTSGSDVIVTPDDVNNNDDDVGGVRSGRPSATSYLIRSRRHPSSANQDEREGERVGQKNGVVGRNGWRGSNEEGEEEEEVFRTRMKIDNH